jgi:hypothetical protein
MSSQQYKNIGKKQIIGVLNEVIKKLQIVEYTLNAFIEFSGEEIAKEFDEFMIKKLGGKDELQSDDKADGGGDNSESNEDS